MGTGLLSRFSTPLSKRIFAPDIVAVVCVTALTNAVIFLPILRESALRVPFGLAFLFFVPGYAFVAALFPEDESRSTVSDRTARVTQTESETGDGGIFGVASKTGIDWVERLALSFGLSVVIVTLLGLLGDLSSWSVSLEMIAFSVTGFVLVCSGVAVVRRQRLAPADRFRLPLGSHLSAGKSGRTDGELRIDTLANVLLIASIVFAFGIGTLAVAAPAGGEQFSTVSIVTENDDGEMVADGYPSEIDHGDDFTVFVDLGNREHREVTYTVVVLEQRLGDGGSNETSVSEQRELDRFETTLAHGESGVYEQNVEPTTTGYVRVAWLLYPDDVPSEPSLENTEYHVHLWLNVIESDD
ncbi:DUF1616 domain-containing protein [Natrarchaeobius oligotrophus]|nr:DUF1616 domain-containing protein [Natrarchaeobius chitinivorans]